jgi:hypothetical protein
MQPHSFLLIMGSSLVSSWYVGSSFIDLYISSAGSRSAEAFTADAVMVRQTSTSGKRASTLQMTLPHRQSKRLVVGVIYHGKVDTIHSSAFLLSTGQENDMIIDEKMVSPATIGSTPYFMPNE